MVRRIRTLLSIILNRTLYGCGKFANLLAVQSAKIIIRNKKTVQIFQSKKIHTFFGYYDLSPFSHDGSKVLAIQADHPLNTPEPFSKVDVGYYRAEGSAKEQRFSKFGESFAWCWQQGCRLQWFPKSGATKTVFYNTIKKREYVGVVQDIDTKEIVLTTPVPIYELSQSGKKGLSINFSRLQRLRPGYGYGSLPDRTESEKIPKNDGIYLYDFKKDSIELVLTYDDIIRKGVLPKNYEKYEHYINHLSFNPSGTRFMFLHLLSDEKRRYSRLLVCKSDGTKLTVVNDTGRASHYAWKDDNQLLDFCLPDGNGPMCYYLYDLEKKTGSRVAHHVLQKDGHPTYLMNGNAILTDSYPDRFGFQYLILFNLRSNSFLMKRRLFRSKKFNKEVRTDLHPRLSADEKRICIDDEHDGFKAIKVFRVIHD